MANLNNRRKVLKTKSVYLKKYRYRVFLCLGIYFIFSNKNYLKTKKDMQLKEEYNKKKMNKLDKEEKENTLSNDYFESIKNSFYFFKDERLMVLLDDFKYISSVFVDAKDRALKDYNNKYNNKL